MKYDQHGNRLLSIQGRILLFIATFMLGAAIPWAGLTWRDIHLSLLGSEKVERRQIEGLFMIEGKVIEASARVDGGLIVLARPLVDGATIALYYVSDRDLFDSFKEGKAAEVRGLQVWYFARGNSYPHPYHKWYIHPSRSKSSSTPFR